MRVIILKSGKTDEILDEILQSISTVLQELQVDIKEIDLDILPYYKGYDTQESQKILQYINQSVGVVVATRVELLSVSGSLVSFFEYCSNYKKSEAFKKPMFAITNTDWRGEREAGEYILHAWDILGGTEFGKLAIYGPNYSLQKDNIQITTERMTEDFYRMIKQDRPAIVSSDHSMYTGSLGSSKSHFKDKLEQENEKYLEYGTVKDKGLEDSQEKDIADLANFFKRQLDEEEGDILEPNIKTTKHMLSSLPHYFQAQYDKDLEVVIQYHMEGEELYSGYVVVKNGDCKFEEGLYSGADVELTADEEVIREILTKGMTAQKAFMLGQLKVRGNFMFLPKIDKIFKAM